MIAATEPIETETNSELLFQGSARLSGRLWKRNHESNAYTLPHDIDKKGRDYSPTSTSRNADTFCDGDE